MTSKPGSGAPARVVVPPPVEVRVAEIRGLMESGTWRPSTSIELAGRWGLSRNRVQEHASEASRQLRSMTREEAAAKVAALLEKAEVAAAYSKTRAADLVRVAQTWMRLHGLDRPAGRGSSGAREIDDPEGESSGDDWWKDGGTDGEG